MLKESELTRSPGEQITCDDFIRRLQLRRTSVQKCINVLEAAMRDLEEAITKLQALSPSIRSQFGFKPQSVSEKSEI